MASHSDSRTSPTLLGKLRRSPTDQGAWEEFVRCYGPKIYGWCRRWKLQDADAHDVTQMVLVRLAARIRDFEYDPTRRFRAWLMTISQHAWSDFITARKNQQGSGDSRVAGMLESLQARDDLIAQMEKAYDLELLDEALRRVRLRVQPKTWEAYHLTAVEGLSGTETAERLNMKVTSVFKAKSNVQKRVQEEVRYLEGSE